MNLFMSLFKMTCKDVYPLISEEIDHSLSFKQAGSFKNKFRDLQLMPNLQQTTTNITKSGVKPEQRKFSSHRKENS